MTKEQDNSLLSIEELCEKYYSLIYVRVLKMVHDRDVAEDVTQEAFLKAVRAFPSLERRDNVFAWLYTIATNAARDELRKQKVREKPLSLDVLKEEHDLLPVSDGREVEEHMEVEYIWQFLKASLTEQEYLFMKARGLGYSYEELRASLGLSTMEAYRLQRRCRQLLKRRQQGKRQTRRDAA